MDIELVLEELCVLGTCILKHSVFSYVRDNLITNYVIFNPTNAQSTMNTPLPLYDVPRTCFGLNMAIFRKVCYERLRYREIPLQKCIFGVKNQMFSNKIAENV